jgi:hypothetical protein
MTKLEEHNVYTQLYRFRLEVYEKNSENSMSDLRFAEATEKPPRPRNPRVRPAFCVCGIANANTMPGHGESNR